MKKEFIVLIPILFNHSLATSKNFKDKEFKTLGDVAKAVTDALKEDEEIEDEEVLVYSLEGFANAVKAKDVDVDHYYTTTVFVVPEDRGADSLAQIIFSD